MGLAEDYRAYVKREKNRLKRLPYFADSDQRREAFLVMFEALSTHDLEAILRWQANACSDPVFRVLALDFMLARRAASPAPVEWPETTLDRDTIVEGDLRVTGNLINGAALTVLGDLTIEGAYLTEGDYPCCQVGGTFAARDYFAELFDTELEATAAQSEAHLQRARKFARMFKVLLPSAWLKGKQPWGAY